MSLDKIVVLILAIGFFGGLAYIYWRSRLDEKKGGQPPSSATPDRIEGDPPKKSKEKTRKASRS